MTKQFSTIYAARCDEAIKIGMTQNIDERMQTLQTGCPSRLRVVKENIISEALAMKTEALLHAICADKRLAGEWFLIDDLGRFSEAFDTAISLANAYEKYYLEKELNHDEACLLTNHKLEQYTNTIIWLNDNRNDPCVQEFLLSLNLQD